MDAFNRTRGDEMVEDTTGSVVPRARRANRWLATRTNTATKFSGASPRPVDSYFLKITNGISAQKLLNHCTAHIGVPRLVYVKNDHQLREDGHVVPVAERKGPEGLKRK